MPDPMPVTIVDAPREDIRSALASAYATHEDVEKPVEKPNETPDEKPVAKGNGNAEQLDLDLPEVKAETEKSEAEAKVEPEKKEPVEDKEPVKAKSADAYEPPSDWKASDKEMFKTLPNEAKEFITRRYKDMVTGFTKKSEALAEFRKEYEPVAKMFEPFGDRLKQLNLTPRAAIQNYIQVEQRLASGDGVAVIKGLVDGYKLAPEKIIQALGYEIAGAQRGGQTNGGAEPPAPQSQSHVPPEVMAEINQLKQWRTQQEQERQQSAQSAQAIALRDSEAKIEQFKSEADDKGNPLRPYYDEVEADMTALAMAYRARNQPMPALQELYEKAVYANPATREALTAAQRRSEEQKRDAEARAKAAAAKKAAVSVTGAPASGQSPAGRGSSARSLREELLAAAEEGPSA